MTSVYSAMPLIMIFSTLIRKFIIFSREGEGRWTYTGTGSSGVWSSSLWNVRNRMFFPLCLSEFVCGWWLCGLIEICDRTSGYGGPLDECPWAPGLLSSLLGGWLSLGDVRDAGPSSAPLFMIVNLTSGSSTCVIQSTTLNVSRMGSKR